MTQRKPTRLKKLAGTHRPDRDPEHEPEPERGPVSMPRGVLPKSARKMWREWAEQLQELGLLTPVDVPMFTLVCVWAGIAVDAAALIREAEEAPGAEQGLVTNDDRDRARKNRALTVLRAASTELRQLSASFGLTPADRAGLDVPGPDEPTLREELELVLRSRKVEVNAEDGS